MMGGTNYRAEIERTLVGLGFSRSDFDTLTGKDMTTSFQVLS